MVCALQFWRDSAEDSKNKELTQSDTNDKPSASLSEGHTTVSESRQTEGRIVQPEESTTDIAGDAIAPIVPAWKQKIIEKNDDNKREINQIGDDFTNKAIVRIEGMPEERREKAAEEYIRSTNNIMTGVKSVMNFSQSIGKYFWNSEVRMLLRLVMVLDW